MTKLKKINLFIHPGYGKTGTTFLQQNIFGKLSYVNLGKPYKKEKNLINKLVSLQYQIFQPKYNFEKNYPLNYSYSIKCYVDLLKNIMNDTDNANFILSDENLFDRNNYFGYLNVYLLKEIVELLNNYFDINVKFIISIRSQHEFLISSYAYENYWIKRTFGSFDNYINNIINNLNISQIYEYDLLITKIKKIFNSDILILPLEELDQNPKNYIEKIENFFNINTKKNNFEITYANKNFKLINGIKNYQIREFDYKAKLFNYFNNIHIFFKKFKIYERNYKYFKFINQIITPGIKIVGNIALTEDQKLKIQKHFKKSNQNTEKITSLNLKKYNYY